MMTVVYSDHHEPEHAAENIRKAYELRGKLSERDRLTLEANYYGNGTGELEKAVPYLELLQQTYPRDIGLTLGLFNSLQEAWSPEKALEHSRRGSPPGARQWLGFIYQNLGADYVNLNLLDEADAVYKEAVSASWRFEGRAKSRYLLAFLKGDQAQMAQLASSATGKRGDEDVMLGAQADTEAWYGRLNELT